MEYAKEVIPFLNTNEQLDDAVEKLWRHWENKDAIDVNETIKDFLVATSLSPNIQRLEHYVPHSLQVSRRCEEYAKTISERYAFFGDKLVPSKMAFMGLIEDSFYLIGGNGKNNPNNTDSNPVHEILTYVQFVFMQYKSLAEGMALHGLASENLAENKKKGNFKEVTIPEKNIVLDVLTGVDFLCTRDYLPDTEGSLDCALEKRIADLRLRRPNDHPLIIDLDNGGEKRLKGLIKQLNGLINGRYSDQEVKLMYAKE